MACLSFDHILLTKSVCPIAPVNFDWKPWAMADIPSEKSRTQLKLDLFMKSHSEQSQDTTEIT